MCFWKLILKLAIAALFKFQLVSEIFILLQILVIKMDYEKIMIGKKVSFNSHSLFSYWH